VTPREAVRRAAARLAAAGVPSPEHDAGELLAHVLGTGRSQLPLLDDVSEEAAERYDRLIARRAAREPLQHLTGEAWFRHVRLEVGPGVFTPRPETELLAGWAVDEARKRTDPVVVDLCTGSGAIAKAVADEVPGARIHAVARNRIFRESHIGRGMLRRGRGRAGDSGSSRRRRVHES